MVGPDLDTGTVETLRTALDGVDVVPLVIGPRGGVIADVTMQRSYAVAASVELDAVVICGAVPPAPDAQPAVDAKAGVAAAAVDPKIGKLLQEVWRHAKAIGVIGGAEEVLTAAGVPADGVGVVRGDPDDVVADLVELLGADRAWERFVSVSRT